MDPEEYHISKRSTKLIFLITIALLLVGTNLYLYFDRRNAQMIIARQRDEMMTLRLTLDSLETQVQAAQSNNTVLSEELKAKDNEMHEKIAALKRQLAKAKLSQKELVQARVHLKNLKDTIARYTIEIQELKQQNASLTQERDTLQRTLSVVNEKASTLTKENELLSSQVQMAAALKAKTLAVTAFKIKNNGKEVATTRAKTAKKLKVYFTLSPNDIAKKGSYGIYLRVLDPTGKPLGNVGTFKVNDKELICTDTTSINYENDTRQYVISWVNPNTFIRGTYEAIVYADTYLMGTTTFKLR